MLSIDNLIDFYWLTIDFQSCYQYPFGLFKTIAILWFEISQVFIVTPK